MAHFQRKTVSLNFTILKNWLPLIPAFAVLSSCAQPPWNAKRSLARVPQSNQAMESGIGLGSTAFRSTAIAAIKQPFTTMRLGAALVIHRPRELVSGNIPSSLSEKPLLGAVPGSDAFEQILTQATETYTEGGRLKFFLNGSSFFGELDQQITRASQSIDCQVFIFDNDDIGVRYADLFKKRSAMIPVRVMFDDFGTSLAHTTSPKTLGAPGFVPPADMGNYLNAGSSVQLRRTLNPWLICDHTKLYVFDRKTALIGGMNIGREYFSEWRDLMVRVEGPVVGVLGYEFERTWQKSGFFGDFATLGPKPEPYFPAALGGEIPVRVLRTHTACGEHQILDAMLLAIRSARTRIWIETPYFAHDDIALAVASAARRGVDVRLIIPSGGDTSLMQAGNLSTARGLIKAGARVYQYPRMTHLKAMICDNWATIGSANLDILSMRLNRELNIAFSDRSTIRELENLVYRPAFRESRRLSLEATDSLVAPLAEIIADQL